MPKSIIAAPSSLLLPSAAPLVPKVTLRLVSSKGDKIISDHVQPAHSWTRNFYNWLSYLCTQNLSSGSTFGAGYLSMKDVGGTIRNLPVVAMGFYNLGAVGNDAYGIVVGTGTTAESFDSYAMATKVANGTGSGQLEYRAQKATTGAYTSGTKTWDFSLVRIFDNTSNGTITVKETGFIIYNVNYAYYFLVCRDLLASSVDVLDDGFLTVTYTVSLQFPG